MTNEIDLRLKKLIALWIDGTPASLECIAPLCDEISSQELVCSEIADLATPHRSRLKFDRELVQRVQRLASRAERRLTACLEIQSRTGLYSTHGALEGSPRIATAGWEG